MKHPTSRRLYAYWDELRGKRAAPARAEIEPGAIRQILSEAFILALDNAADYPFRLAGTRMCALFCCELKARPFLSLWDEGSQGTVRELFSTLIDESIGTVAGVSGTTVQGDAMDLELLLLPLSATRPNLARAIGIMAPLSVPPWIGINPIGPLTLRSHRHIGTAIEKRLLPRFLTPRSRRGLVVYDGGRS